MAVFGRDSWTRSGEGFAVAFSLLARIAPFAVRDGRVVVRWPLTGLVGAERVQGTLVFIAVMLGSTSFDGFSRTTTWQNVIANTRARLVDQPLWFVDLATTFVNLVGLAYFVAARRGDVPGGRDSRSPARPCASFTRARSFVLPIVPIAFAYLLAHYFSLFVIQGQFIIPLASDPFGRGWDLFGTVDYAPNLAAVSPDHRLVRPGGLRSFSATSRGSRSRTTEPSRCSRVERRSTLSVPDARADGAVHGWEGCGCFSRG